MEDKQYGLNNCQPFYTYYDVGVVYLGIQLPMGIVAIPISTRDWLAILDSEREKALSFITPIPNSIIKAFDGE